MLWIKIKLNRYRARVARYLLNSTLPKVVSILLKQISRDDKAFAKQNDLARLRMSVCRQCQFFKKSQTCSLCYCYMPAKTQMESASCPKGKW